MDTPTKFDSMVENAFAEKKLPVIIELKDKKPIGVIYGHDETKCVSEEIRYIMTKMNPDTLFSRIKHENKINYEDQPFDQIIESIQDRLWKIIIIDNTKKKYQQIVEYILSKNPFSQRNARELEAKETT